jgi:hypothetical protein
LKSRCCLYESICRIVSLSVLALLVCAAGMGAEGTTPEQFFGFKLGTDKKLARYDKIVEYLQKLAGQSDRVRVRNLGPTTLGNPYILVGISSPENRSTSGQDIHWVACVLSGRVQTGIHRDDRRWP